MTYNINQNVQYHGELWVIIAIKDNGDLLLSRYESDGEDTAEIIKRVKPDDLGDD